MKRLKHLDCAMRHNEHTNSLQLVALALSKNPNQAFWCREMQVSRTTLSVALNKGYVTPLVAADLARLLGEDIEHWTTIAYLDSQKQTHKVSKLRALVTGESQQRHTYTAS